MATNNTIAIPAKNVRSLDTNAYVINAKPTLPIAAAADSITLFTFPHAARMFSAHLRQPATVGGGVTLKLQKNTAGTRTDITLTTTAATAGVVASTGLLPVDFAAGDTVEVLVTGGANAAVVIEYDLLCQHA